MFERMGLHVTAVHFHSPIPNTHGLPPDVWKRRSAMIGIDLQLQQQRALLQSLSAKYHEEFDQFPLESTGDASQFFLHNDYFGTVDAEILYSMVREHKPRRVVEIGSGNSSRLIAAALRQNDSEGAPRTTYTIIDPYAASQISTVLPQVTEVVRQPVQRVPLTLFESLEAGDVLFIDSSHVVATDSDVWYEFLEILPRIAVGVLVQVHDIFLPDDYPRDWLLEKRLFWNEQYLLQAFLTFNDRFEVLWAGRAMAAQYPDDLRRAIRSFEQNTHFPASLWIRRVR
jgi:predicted O-methyltransferase YrrM